MKSRQDVKKYIKKAFSEFYRDIVLYEAFSIKPDVDAARKLTSEVIDIENELISRVSVNEGKYVKGRMKHYFQKLKQDLEISLETIGKKITELP